MGFAFSIARLAALAFVCAGFFLSAQPAVSQEVKLNEVLRSLFYAPQYVAVRTGAFEQEGLKLVGPKDHLGRPGDADRGRQRKLQHRADRAGSRRAHAGCKSRPAARQFRSAHQRRRRVHPLENPDAQFHDRGPEGQDHRHVRQGLNARPRARSSDQEGRSRSQQGRHHPQHSGVGQHHSIVSRAEHEFRAGLRADDRAGGRREQGTSRRLGR